MQNFILLPRPAAIVPRDGSCPCDTPLGLPHGFEHLAEAVRGIVQCGDWMPVELSENPELPHEAYVLTVTEKGAVVEQSGEAGLLYALITLGQLILQSGGNVHCCRVEDRPALPVRGFMLDISRGKVPTLETLCAIADKMALLKMNHLQLYIEGLSFAYPSFERLWRDKTPLAPDEIKQFADYCKLRHIDLVPNQNSLGHMDQWLSFEEFRQLAECPDGGLAFGRKTLPNTLDPTDAGSLELVTKLTDDLLPCFDSAWFNANLDEPFELGKGKNSAAQADGKIGEVYLEFAIKLHDMLAQRGKRMMMWGDIVAKHPELVEKLPDDMIIMEWGYEAEHPFEQRAAALQAAGLDFCLCPGSSSWSSYAGITDNMLVNVRTAIDVARRYDARGIILTDWGDGGHLQYLPVTYASLALTAYGAWSADAPDDEWLADALDMLIFRDDAKVMGRFALELGRHNRFDELALPCRTMASLASMAGLQNSEAWERLVGAFMGWLEAFLIPDLMAVYKQNFVERKEFDYGGLVTFLDEQQRKLDSVRMTCSDAELVKREYANTIAILRYFGAAHAYNAGFADSAALAVLRSGAACIIAEHHTLWNARNKPYGLEASIASIVRISEQALAIE